MYGARHRAGWLAKAKALPGPAPHVSACLSTVLSSEEPVVFISGSYIQLSVSLGGVVPRVRQEGLDLWRAASVWVRDLVLSPCSRAEALALTRVPDAFAPFLANSAGGVWLWGGTNEQTSAEQQVSV